METEPLNFSAAEAVCRRDEGKRKAKKKSRWGRGHHRGGRGLVLGLGLVVTLGLYAVKASETRSPPISLVTARVRVGVSVRCSGEVAVRVKFRVRLNLMSVGRISGQSSVISRFKIQDSRFTSCLWAGFPGSHPILRPACSGRPYLRVHKPLTGSLRSR